MNAPALPPAAPPAVAPEHAGRERIAARHAFDTAQRLFFATADEPAERAEAVESMRVLYWQSVRASLCAVTPDGKLSRWADAQTFEAEAPAEVRAVAKSALAARLASGVPASESPAAELVEARSVAERLLEIIERPSQAVERERTVAVLRAVTSVAAALVIAGVVGAVLFAVFRRPDLAQGHPFRTSSQLPNCFPEQGVCAGSKVNLLFHTNEEESPWIEYDLEQPTRFSGLTVVNRQDGSLHRAVPLLVEVSDDQKRWKDIARRDDEFSTWRPRFSEVTARYVRLRVNRRTQFHLESVRIHP